MSKQIEFVAQLQAYIVHFVEQTSNQSKWGLDYGGNQGLALDISHEMSNHPDELRLLKADVTEQGLTITATIGPAITSWSALQGAVYRLLGAVSEQFLAVIPFRDERSLTFWFATGYVTTAVPEGHRGVFMLPWNDVSHLDPDEVIDARVRATSNLCSLRQAVVPFSSTYV